VPRHVRSSADAEPVPSSTKHSAIAVTAPTLRIGSPLPSALQGEICLAA
jgi:hypothetical protein